MLRNATFSCVNGCEETKLSLETYEAHLSDHCEQRWVKCDQCGCKVRSCDLKDHRTEECQRLQVDEELEEETGHDGN